MNKYYLPGVSIDEPYAIFVAHPSRVLNWETRVLATYDSPDVENRAKHINWLVAAKSDMTNNEWEYGDEPRKDIIDTMYLLKASPAFIQAYSFKIILRYADAEIYDFMTQAANHPQNRSAQ